MVAGGRWLALSALPAHFCDAASGVLHKASAPTKACYNRRDAHVYAPLSRKLHMANDEVGLVKFHVLLRDGPELEIYLGQRALKQDA